jgi:hypothetical protein
MLWAFCSHPHTHARTSSALWILWHVACSTTFVDTLWQSAALPQFCNGGKLTLHISSQHWQAAQLFTAVRRLLCHPIISVIQGLRRGKPYIRLTSSGMPYPPATAINLIDSHRADTSGSHEFISLHLATIGTLDFLLKCYSSELHALPFIATDAYHLQVRRWGQSLF